MELRIVRQLVPVGLALLLASCMAAPQTAGLDATLPEENRSRVVIEGVPFYPQEAYQCGPAALATLLGFHGESVTPAMLVDEVFVPGRNGSFQVEMLAAARAHGKLSYALAPELTDLLLEVAAGNPVLVLQNLGLRLRPQWHFAVVKGYDYAAQDIILNSGTIEDYSLSLKTFERTWERANHWAVVMQVPGSVPVTASAARYFQSLVDLKHSYPDPVALRAAYDAGLERWPGDRQLLLGLGNHLLAAESYYEAAEVYALTVGRYPDFPPALNNLAHTLLILGDARRALAYAQQALEHADDFHTTYRNTRDEILAALEAEGHSP